MANESFKMEKYEVFVDNIVTLTKEKALLWCKIVDKLGLDEETQKKWIETFTHEVLDTHQDMINGAVDVQTKLINSIEELLKRSEELCKTLQLKMPLYGSDDLSLFAEKQLLQGRIQEYEKLLNSRLKEISAVKKRELEICSSLGCKPRSISEDPLPSEAELSNLYKRIESLENEKFKREERFLTIKSDLVKIANQLGIEPSLDLERVVLSDDDSLFMVTDANMKWLQNYHTSLLKQREQTKIEIDRLRDRLRGLWELLEEDIKSTSEFLNSHTGYSLQTLESLKGEVKRCEDLKKANIQKFITNLRNQMQHLWTKCHFTLEQRENFEYFHDSCYTEDLLMIHDMEINKLNKFYEANREILSLLEKREQLWSKMVELEERSLAPGRFKNRGGQLLHEEKQRNKLQKSIPEIEEQLLRLASNYQEQNGNEFTSNGQTIREIIAKTHETHDKEKKLKLSARKQQRELTLTPGKSCLSVMPSSSHKTLMTTPCTSSKRKLMTPLFPSSVKRKKEQTAASGKRQLITPSGSNKGAKDQATGFKSAAPKIQVNGKTVNINKRRSLERNKRMKNLRRISDKLEKKKLALSSSENNTTYNAFEVELSNRQTCRSTLYQSDVLAEPLPPTPNIPSGPKPSSSRTPQTTALRLKTASRFKLDF